MGVWAKMVDGLEVDCDLCDVAVLIVSKIPGDEFVKPVSSYGLKGSREQQKEKKDACGAAENVKNESPRR